MHFPVTLQFKPSRRLRAALVFAHLLALASVLLVISPWPYALLVIPFLGGSLVRCWRRIEAPALTLAPDGGVSWPSPDGEPLSGRILAGAVACSWLVLLRVRLEDAGQTRVLVVSADSLSPADYRKLQVWLRWLLPVKAASVRA